MAAGKDADTGAVALNILQRYVIFEVVRAFSLALLTMTAIFVLFMVAAQARDIGLSPQDIVELVPYVIPSTLPYTIPVSLLFAVTVVYGRLAGDNEIIAVKTAGVSVMKILWPTYHLAIALSVLLLYLSGTLDPPVHPPGQDGPVQGPGRHLLQDGSRRTTSSTIRAGRSSSR